MAIDKSLGWKGAARALLVLCQRDVPKFLFLMVGERKNMYHLIGRELNEYPIFHRPRNK
ncbi:MAG: hypothetical protein WA705_08470 [Candidatus Ozemobacteraceae bacterium]